MADSHVLRIPRTEEEGSFVLVQVTSAGSHDLDVKLVATEGFAPYMVKLRHDRTSALKVKNCPCSQDEWEHFLAATLLNRGFAPEIEAAAHVAEEDSITITVRRRVQGITQRLGTLALRHDESQDIQLFEWCSAAIAGREGLKADLSSATSKARELEEAVAELRSQLEELIQAKESDESVLLQRFRDLLNEKKVKIREQQRLLASAIVDPTTTLAPARQAEAKMEDVEDNGPRRVPRASRSSKRKAAQATALEDESDNALERMEVDKKHGEEDSEEQQATDLDEQQTTDQDETGSEPEDGDEEPIPRGRRHWSSQETEAPAATVGEAASEERAGTSRQTKVSEAPPPRRALPFGLGKASKKAPKQEEGSETEDDEL